MTDEVKRCVRCILPANYPGVTFDSEGICSYCRMFEQRWKNWVETDREPEFLEIVRRGRKGNPNYDALVGISGGKDSCYTLHAMVKKYNFKVLAYTFDNMFFSDGARDNIAKMVSRLGVEHRYITTGHELGKRLYQSLFKKRCADICMICANGALSAAIDLALSERVYTIVWGLSPRTEPILPFELLNAYDFRFLADVARPSLTVGDLHPYRHCSLARASYATFLQKVRFVFLPEYIEWHGKEIARFLEREYDWVDYGRGAPHFDCAINPAINYFMNQRCGASKVVEKVSTMIRCGQLTRDEAFAKKKEQDTVEEPVAAVDELCRRLDVTRDDLKPYLEGNTVDYRSFKNTVGMLRKLSPAFWLMYKLGLTSESLYQKYRIK